MTWNNQPSNWMDGIKSRAGTQPERGGLRLGQSDGLAQITLPLIMILAVSLQLMTIVHAEETQSTSRAIDRIVDLTPTDLLIELWKQRLIRRIDDLALEHERRWNMHLCPSSDRVHWQNGWPNDDAFSELCTKTFNELGGFYDERTREELVRQFYVRALRHRQDGLLADESDHEWVELFDDELVPPESAYVDRLGIVMHEEQRLFALEYIDRHFLDWIDRVENLQFSVVEHILELQISGNSSLLNSDMAKIEENLAREMRNRDCPLLPGVLAPEEGS